MRFGAAARSALRAGVRLASRARRDFPRDGRSPTSTGVWQCPTNRATRSKPHRGSTHRSILEASVTGTRVARAAALKWNRRRRFSRRHVDHSCRIPVLGSTHRLAPIRAELKWLPQVARRDRRAGPTSGRWCAAQEGPRMLGRRLSWRFVADVARRITTAWPGFPPTWSARTVLATQAEGRRWCTTEWLFARAVAAIADFPLRSPSHHRQRDHEAEGPSTRHPGHSIRDGPHRGRACRRGGEPSGPARNRGAGLRCARRTSHRPRRARRARGLTYRSPPGFFGGVTGTVAPGTCVRPGSVGCSGCGNAGAAGVSGFSPGFVAGSRGGC